jgi:glucose/arabinose dehydrogenase
LGRRSGLNEAGGSLSRGTLVAWGLRNAYGLLFLPDGRLLAIGQGADDRGSRPVGNVPDLLFEGNPGAWYGWPDFARTSAISLATSSDRVELSVDYDLPGGLLGDLLDRLYVERRNEREAEHSLQNLKDLVEGRPAG